MDPILSIVIGPMFSGKSSYLIENINKCLKDNKTIFVINHNIDQRYNDINHITNHNKISVDCISLNKIKQFFDYTNEKNIDISLLDYLFIDEAQFFDDLEENIKKMLETYPNLKITCVGLDGDFQQKLFNDGQLLKLIPYAEKVIKLHATCSICGSKAFFTNRKTKQKEQILVASNNIYQSVCYIHK
jgi:thymidine kinase